jgi:WD40 repeat protein
LSVRFSPDNRYLLTAGQFDGLVRLLEAESGRVVRNLGTASYGGTRRALFTPDGSSIVAGSKDGTLRVWDVRTGELRREIPHAIRSLDDLAIAAGGAYAVTVGGGTLQVWSLSTGARVADLSALAAAAVVAADPAGTLVVAGSNDGTVTAMDFTTGRRLWQTRAHRGQAISLAIAPSRRLVASGGTDSFIYLWNGSTGALERTIATENGSVRNMNFDRSGAKIAAAGQWRTKLWDLDDSTRAPLSFGGAQGMTDVDITPDARFLANCHGASGLVRLWDASADARVDHWGGHSSMVTGLIVAGGASFASSAVDGTVSLWQSGQTSPRFSLKPGARVSGLAIDDTKRWIVSVGYPGTAAVWDARDGRNAATISAAGSSRAALFVDGNRRLVIGDGDGTLEFWDWSDGAARNQRRVAAPAEGEVLALAAHGSRLFIAHRETIIVIRDVATGAEIRRMRPAASPFSLAVSPDGRMLASGLWPGLVDLWDVETGRRIDSLKGPTALVHGLDFNADGSLLALSSRDGSTRLWDVAAKEWLATVASRKVGAERVRFLPDGRRLAIGYEDGEVEIRDLDHFFRYVAGHAEYQLRTLRAAGEWFPRSGDVLEWSGRILSAPRN